MEQTTGQTKEETKLQKEGTKRQGTTSVVPNAPQKRHGLQPLRDLFGHACTILIVVTAIATAAHAEDAAPAPAARADIRWHDVSLDDYRKHLGELTTLVQACEKARDLKTCDPLLVGPDDRVPLAAAPGARRMVRYGWLRVLFSMAEDKDATPKPVKDPAASTLPPPPTTTQLLKDAEVRIQQELAEAGGAAAANPGHAEQREVMKQVLAGREFRGLHEQTARDSALEKFGNWLNRLFDSAARFGARSAWVGRVIVWGFIVAVCIGLAWSLLQLERRWRIRLTPEIDAPAPDAPSARNWQLWLGDAREAAAGGHWREAIHSVYWASISRLESRRLWPADRARTPREYLALLAADDPRRAGLLALTGSFERTWYGGREAGERDYQRAEEVAAGLIAGAVAAEAAEGGRR